MFCIYVSESEFLHFSNASINQKCLSLKKENKIIYRKEDKTQ